MAGQRGELCDEEISNYGMNVSFSGLGYGASFGQASVKYPGLYA